MRKNIKLFRDSKDTYSLYEKSDSGFREWEYIKSDLCEITVKKWFGLKRNVPIGKSINGTIDFKFKKERRKL